MAPSRHDRIRPDRIRRVTGTRVVADIPKNQPDNADDVSRPEWFAAFLADRGTRKPSAHSMKAYRQDFDAIATLVAGTETRTAKSRNYHDRKRSEGKRHSQSILCLARRRLNVLWAMQRDNTSYQPGLPRAA
jgi:hypothetical protein